MKVVSAGLKAARILRQRIDAKHRYRRRRDRKIVIDWLGREFSYADQTFRISSYDPNRHTVRMILIAGPGTIGQSWEWETDRFWKLSRNGGKIR